MKDARKLDLNAPRFRRIAEGTLNKQFIDAIKEKLPSAKDLSAKDIKNIVTTFNGVLWQHVVDNRDGAEIPEQIGHLFIGTCPPKKKKNVDYRATLEYMKVIQHRNWESDQHLAKIFFTTVGTKYRFRHNELWGFVPTREFKRTVGRTYPELWKMYVEVDPNLKMKSIYQKMNYKIVQVKQAEEQIDTTNLNSKS